MFSIFLPFASCEFKRYIDIEFLRVRQITALKYAVCAINIFPSDQIVEIWLLEMSDSIETGIVSVSNDDCLVFRMISFHHIIQSRVFIINIAWMNHTVNKATVKGMTVGLTPDVDRIMDSLMTCYHGPSRYLISVKYKVKKCLRHVNSPAPQSRALKK